MRRIIWAVVVAIVGFAALSPALGDRALDNFERAMERGDYERAVRIGEGIATRHPQSSVAAYNMGCALSRAGRLDESVEWLVRSADLGFGGVRSIRDDADLEAVRGHEGFAVVVEKVEANAAARFEEFRAAAEKAEPTVVLPRGHDPTKATPLVIALHGTGGTGAGTARQWQRAAGSVGAILIAPDALRPAGQGYSWTYRDESEWLIMRTIAEAREKWAIGPVVLVGFSQGANIALMMGQSHASEFAGVIPVCGHWEADVAEMPREGERPRWCLLIGARDPWARTYEAAESALEGAGMEVHRHVAPGLGHEMPPSSMLAEALAWCLSDPDGEG